jgi:epoxide hydrolase-like predicted phosphatase
MRKINFIYFDLGGVVILDFSKTNKWQELFEAIGIDEEHLGEFRKFFHEYEQQLNTGMSFDIFIERAKHQFKLTIQTGEELLNGFVTRFEVNPTIQPLLSELLEEYRLGLLTNMYPGMFKAIKSRSLLPNINWEVVVDSSLEGFAKPQLEIYLLAQERIGLKPENILFVDNLQRNITTARNLGWETVLYDPLQLEESNEKIKKALSL